MSFDIHALDNFDPDENQSGKAVAAYQEALLEQFYNFCESKQGIGHDNVNGYWSAQLIHFGIVYVGVSIPQMDVMDVEEIVSELFPEKVTIQSPEEADHIIPELIVFWQFLKREYNLPHADRILSYLSIVEPDYRRIMIDPSKYGMTKSFVMSGRSAGFDMTNEADLAEYVSLYNANLNSQMAKNQDQVQMAKPGKSSKKAKNKKKKLRKLAKFSRKKNKS